MLDLAIRLVRARFWPLLGLMALLTLPTVSLQAAGFTLSFVPILAPLTEAPPVVGLGALLGPLLQNLASLLQVFLLQGLAPLVIAQTLADEWNGERHSLWGTLHRLAPRWADALVLLILIVAVGIGLYVWWVFVPIVGWFTGGGGVLFFANVVAPAAMFILVVERRPAVDALTRAWFLLRDRFWGSLWLVGLASLATQLSLVGVAALLSAALFWLFSLAESSLGSVSDDVIVLLGATGVGLVTSTITNLLVTPVTMATVAALYRDARIQREGLDLAVSASGGQHWSAIPAPDQAPAQNLIRGRDLLDWFLLTLGVIGFVIGSVGLYFGLLFLVVFVIAGAGGGF